jgi:RNA polymerase sigma-70 factor (family 1)
MLKESHTLNRLAEPDLIYLVKSGNRKAFEEIYERYWLKLYKTAHNRIKSPNDAKDIVQDLFISFWMKKELLEINSSLSSYLFAALKYKIINYIEANLVKSHYLNSINKAVIDIDNHTNEELKYKELQEILESGINKLSPKVKEVFELSRKEQMSNKEIAHRLNISHQTVKNQISKAIKTLRVHLNNSSFSLLFCIILFEY